jgi:hypothetical protein
MDWIRLAQDGDPWRTLVDTPMKFPNVMKGGKYIDQLNHYQFITWSLCPCCSSANWFSCVTLYA